MFRNGENAARPLVQFASFDLRLCNVIENEFLIGKLLHKLIGNGQVAGINQNVAGEAESRKHAHAAQKLLAQQESVVRLGLNDVAETAQLLKSGKMLESLFYF